VITAKSFVESARGRGIDWYAGVPCSFLTPFIDYVIDDPHSSYVSSANEGDAVACAAGAVIGGRGAAAMMQNSGLGNAVSPLTSLAYVFRIPVLLICTHRGAPGVQDEPQHALMGQITEQLFTSMKIPSEPFPSTPERIDESLERASLYFKRESRPYAFIVTKGSVEAFSPKHGNTAGTARGPHATATRLSAGGLRPSRKDAIKRLLALTPERGTAVIATTGFTGRELYAIRDRPNHLYMVGSMGCASSLALGLALARPDLKVIVIDGDGAALMRMGNLATVGNYAGGNLTHLLLDNEAHDSTGAQATVSAGVDFAAVATACGYGLALSGDDLGLIDELLRSADGDRPKFGHLKITTGTLQDLPRPAIEPPEILHRFMAHIGSRARP